MRSQNFGDIDEVYYRRCANGELVENLGSLPKEQVFKLLAALDKYS